MAGSPGTPVTSLYVHVPFCARKCRYCAFYSEVADAPILGRYVEALCRELKLAAPGLEPATVYFGGGTPSLLTPAMWERTFATFRQLFPDPIPEWTIECNPGTVTPEKARLWRQAGVNRISLGVQSLHDPLLERLGRIHSRADVFRSVETLRGAGFDNLNLDLMFAIPGQTRAVWRETLREALALGSEHLSSYEVIYEEDTPLFAERQAGLFALDEDLASDMYEDLVAAAQGAGFHQYEVANFARHLTSPPAEIPNRACRHNVNYWRGGSFYGAGPGATSYLDGVRTANCDSVLHYCELIEQGGRAVESREQLPPLARAGETAAFGLRMTAGWPFDLFQETTGFDLRREWAGEMEELVACGWARRDDQRFALTPQGLRFADAAAREFLRPD